MSDSRINIVVVRYCYTSGGGPEKLIHAMAKYLNPDILRLTVVLWFHPGTDLDYYQKLKRTGIAVECVHVNRFNPWIVIQLIQLIRKYKAQVLHTHDFLSDIYGIVAAKIAGVPSICSAHGFVQCSWKIKAYEFVDLKLMRFFDRVIAGSQAMKGFLFQEGIKQERICFVNNAIDIEEMKGCGKGCDFKKEYGINPDQTIVGVVGRLSSEKGHADLLRAAARISAKAPNLCYVVVGEGAQMLNLKMLTKDLGLVGQVVFTGYYHNIHCFLEHCDIFVLPSLRESLPLSLVEAMSLGIPVVATRVGGVPELVIHGKTGLLVMPGNVAAMGDAITKLYTDPSHAKKLGRQGKKKVEQEYCARGFADKIAKIYSTFKERTIS